MKGQGFIIHILLLCVIIGAGIYMVQYAPAEYISLLIQQTADNPGLVGITDHQLKSLPLTLRLFLVSTVKRITVYLQSGISIIVFSIVVGMVEAKIKLNTHITVPSMTKYHTGKSMLLIALVYIPLLYAALPVEGILNIHYITYRYMMITVNALLYGMVCYTLLINHPPMH